MRRESGLRRCVRARAASLLLSARRSMPPRLDMRLLAMGGVVAAQRLRAWLRFLRDAEPGRGLRSEHSGVLRLHAVRRGGQLDVRGRLAEYMGSVAIGRLRGGQRRRRGRFGRFRCRRTVAISGRPVSTPAPAQARETPRTRSPRCERAAARDRVAFQPETPARPKVAWRRPTHPVRRRQRLTASLSCR
jgi:hypothetical protein